MGVVNKINQVLCEREDPTGARQEAENKLKANGYIDDTNRACRNCEYYEEESYESFGACLLVSPNGTKDENYVSYQTTVQNYGVCEKFKFERK